MNGIWTKKEFEQHQSSPKLAAWLASYLPKETPVIDFGCGNGYYMAELGKSGFACIGIDGCDEGEIICKHFQKMDLTRKINAEIKCSIVSLEVGEHLPKSAQEVFMQNLTDNCDKHLVLSWAEIGQPGIGHINCRSQEDVITDVEHRGFTLNKEATEEARQNIDDNTDWFRRTLLIFERV